MTEPHRNPSSTPPPVTEEMIEAGVNAYRDRLMNSATYYEDRVEHIYLAMNAARSNQEATPDAVAVVARAMSDALNAGKPPIVQWDRLHRDERELYETAARAAIAAMAAATPVQKATRTVGDAELGELLDRFETAVRVNENMQGSNDTIPLTLSAISVKERRAAIIDALSHPSSCGRI